MRVSYRCSCGLSRTRYYCHVSHTHPPTSKYIRIHNTLASHPPTHPPTSTCYIRSHNTLAYRCMKNPPPSSHTHKRASGALFDFPPTFDSSLLDVDIHQCYQVLIRIERLCGSGGTQPARQRQTQTARQRQTHRNTGRAFDDNFRAMSKVGFADALRILRGMPTDYLQGGIYSGCWYAKSESFLIVLS